MIKKLSCLVSTVILLTGMGCSLFNADKKTPITKDEYSDLVSFAKRIISKLPSKRLSPSDKHYISSHDPAPKIIYTGYKTGSVCLKWNIPNGTEIQYVAEGKIMDFQSSFKNIKMFNTRVHNKYKKR